MPIRLWLLNGKGPRMLLSLLLATIALPQAQEALPSPMLSRWEIVGGSKGNDHAIDPETLKRDGDMVRAFVRVRLDGDRRIQGVVEYRYDCKANTMERLRAGLFANDGTPLTEAVGDGVVEPVTDGSPGANLARNACRRMTGSGARR